MKIRQEIGRSRCPGIPQLLSAAVVLAAVACGGEPPPPEVPPQAPPPQPSATMTVTSQAAPAKTEDDGSSGSLNIARDIRLACGISEAEALFAFDSATVRQGDLPVLDKLATCFKTGPLAGRNMRLVGHADPRGDEEYNMVLGGRRAEGVKTYLTRVGLNPAQAETTSRGEMDAMGTDDATWIRDRRVDVVLAN